MAETIFKGLRVENNYDIDQVAAELDITTAEYELIESGVAKISYEQAGKLGKFYGIDPKHLLGVSESVNYNIGRYSRTIYAQKYYEKSEESETNNKE
ncbi:helix-turn-helix domain-containing protein [Parapedobacter tibetensis]|uniref:helix-turn-helix domain-containing protein n=1 Tax=Parapedobacter tibetensis TaxID=2972951 RepID=UPI00214DBC5A|nr:helix-turn-helix transcriptional regulator [Parapedobacter tibetensis]